MVQSKNAWAKPEDLGFMIIMCRAEGKKLVPGVSSDLHASE